MTLEELDKTLPNGLHDARISKLLHDFENATLKLEVQILTALPHQVSSGAYRNATITFSKLLFSTVQMPENERIVGKPGSVWFKFQRLGRDEFDTKVSKVVPDGALCYSLYVLDWEACITLAAMEARFEWAT